VVVWCLSLTGFRRSVLSHWLSSHCFFFQAEDGIRDLYVTGVQTCALPICTFPELWASGRNREAVCAQSSGKVRTGKPCSAHQSRSEERRVGKECFSPW